MSGWTVTLEGHTFPEVSSLTRKQAKRLMRKLSKEYGWHFLLTTPDNTTLRVWAYQGTLKLDMEK